MIWEEIFHSISQNKLRTALTGFSIAWGIFMLVVLVGAGKGLENGIMHEFRDDATNILRVWAGKTSKPFKGMPVDREIEMTNEDYQMFQGQLNPLESISGRFYMWGHDIVSYGNRSTPHVIYGVHPDHEILEKTIIVEGRYINEIDIEKARKVVIMGLPTKETFFPKEEAIGKWVKIDHVPFKVIGIFKDEGPEEESRKLFVPITSSQKIFGGRNQNRIHQMIIGVDTKYIKESEEIEDQVVKLLAKQHQFDPTDKKALQVFNFMEVVQRNMDVIVGIQMFVLIIGMSTIAAGVVGVSNVMMIAVKERVKEIGVRKALGATPFSVIKLVLMEALFITGVAGYLGLLAGVGLLELIKKNLPEDVNFFRNPEVDIWIAVGAVLLLVMAGCLAGLFPAMRAARIKPVEALRDE